MIEKNLNKIEKLVNSELSSKILNTEIKFSELLLKVSVNEVLAVIQFLKSDKRLKFRQLIDIAAIDYPNDEKRFEIVYLLL
jgi:NADH-quinone oxidoreductase subunit C